MGHTVALDIESATLNKKSKGKTISTYITAFPASFGTAVVLVDSVQIWHNGQHVSATKSDIQGSILMLKFYRKALIDMLDSAGELELEVRGQFVNGELFQGTDTIMVKKRG